MKRLQILFLGFFGLVCSLSSYAAVASPAAKLDTRLPAIKLFNSPDHRSHFVRGSIASLDKIPSQQFWLSNTFEAWQQGTHPAPRKQYVLSLKGKLKFTVSDGSSFILTPGTVLLAEDTQGEGHSWQILDGKEWLRAYIPMQGDDDHFVAN